MHPCICIISCNKSVYTCLVPGEIWRWTTDLTIQYCTTSWRSPRPQIAKFYTLANSSSQKWISGLLPPMLAFICYVSYYLFKQPFYDRQFVDGYNLNMTEASRTHSVSYLVVRISFSIWLFLYVSFSVVSNRYDFINLRYWVLFIKME